VLVVIELLLSVTGPSGGGGGGDHADIDLSSLYYWDLAIFGVSLSMLLAYCMSFCVSSCLQSYNVEFLQSKERVYMTQSRLQRCRCVGLTGK
jgi:hypothetical protein